MASEKKVWFLVLLLTILKTVTTGKRLFGGGAGACMLTMKLL